MIVFSFVVIAANFAESQKVALASKIWMGLFTAHTCLLPVFGIVDFSAYDEWEVAGCRSGGDECYEWAEVELETAYGPLVVNTTRGTAQEPPVPWYVLWYLDWGWFALLGLAVVFLPDSPALKVTYTLDESSGALALHPSPSTLPLPPRTPHGSHPGVAQWRRRRRSRRRRCRSCASWSELRGST